MSDPSTLDLSGQTVGDFRVLRKIGQGGMGQVYLADQLSLKRKVALKFLRPDHAANTIALQRFRAEAEAIARLNHPNIVQVYAIGDDAGRPYMALEYVESRNLRDHIARKGPFDLPLSLTIMRQVAAALQRAGEHGIIHRDIKPENVLLTRKAEVKVADFGLSRTVTGDDDEQLALTRPGTTMGTPLYMSPEQAQSRPLDSRTDIYSFGVMAYHMLAGEPPFRGTTPIEVALKHINATPKPLAEVRPDLPPELCRLVHKMMAKSPDDRPQTGREVLRELATIRVPDGGSAPTEALPTPAPAKSQWPLWAGFAALLVLAAGVGVGIRLLIPRPVPLPTEPPLPAPVAVSSEEKQLHELAHSLTNPTNPSQVRVGLEARVGLGLLYQGQNRWDEAEKFYTALRTGEGVHEAYQMLGQLGTGVVLAHRDKPDESNRQLAAAMSDPQRLGKFFGFGLGMKEMAEFRERLVHAIERNAKAGPVPPELDRFVKQQGKPRVRPKDKMEKGDKG